MTPNTSKTIARFEQAWQELIGPEAAVGTMTLPAATPHAEPDADLAPDRISEFKPARAAAASKPAPRQFPRGARVLVVDDMRIVRDTVSLMVRSFGLETAGALNAAEARAAVADPHSRLDLIVSDLMMPDIDGRDLIADIREQRPNVPAILISGCFDDDTLAAFRHPPPGTAHTELLAKPFSLVQLRDLILSLIGVDAQPAHEAPAAPALAA